MQTAIETIFGFATSYVGSKLGDLTGYKITKTKANADNMFDHYLGKTFTAEIRKTAGRSSSALCRQADAFLKKSIFLDNVTQGVSSVIGSIFVSSPSVALKNFINENVF